MPHINANGVRTFYRIEGEGPPLLLIAGNGMDNTCFAEQIPEFSRYFKCIVYDMRGVGRSDIPDDGYTPATMARDALALLEALDIQQAHVAGYSLGGAIGLEMALADPPRVKSLSLYASYDRPDGYLRLRYELLLKILTDATPEIWAMFSAFSAFGESYISDNEHQVAAEIAKRKANASKAEQSATAGLAGHYRAILSHDVASRMQQITCPTWIAVGTQDPVMPPKYAQRLHGAILGSQLEIFVDKPHRLLNFQAEEFSQRALAFLRAQA